MKYRTQPNCCQITSLSHAKLAKEIRKEMFACEHFKFAGCFPQNSKGTSVLYSLKLLIAMILGGLSADINTQAYLTIAQLIFNSKKKSTKNESDSKNNQHTPSREPPLPLYLGLKLHSVTWSKN